MKNTHVRPYLILAAGLLGTLLSVSNPAQAEEIVPTIFTGQVQYCTPQAVTLATPQGPVTVPWSSTQFVINGFPVAPANLAVGMTVQANVYVNTPYTVAFYAGFPVGYHGVWRDHYAHHDPDRH